VAVRPFSRNSSPAWKASAARSNRVTGNDSSRHKDQGLEASAADYGSAEHHEKFAESLATPGRMRSRYTDASPQLAARAPTPAQR
jgi:hypothetical protein